MVHGPLLLLPPLSPLLLYLQVEPGKPGAEVPTRKKAIRQRKKLPIECAQGDQPVRCPNRGFCAHQPSAVPSGDGVFVVAGCVSVVCWWW